MSSASPSQSSNTDHTLPATLAADGVALTATVEYRADPRGRYALTRLHATGGVGQVWLAYDDQLDREVALKELRPERAGDPAYARRFFEEARITGRLDHPGVVPVYELVRSSDQPPFYTMRFVRGRTLREAAEAYHRRRRTGQAEPLELRQLLAAVIAVCQAVAYAHARGVLHRDLKGHNVVLGDYGEVIVLDWGLAKLVGSDAGAVQPEYGTSAGTAEPVDATLPGQALGTPAYMAPEQADGRLDLIDARTDITVSAPSCSRS
jgi:eukaryotic-like serine/threonine-protein kinase